MEQFLSGSESVQVVYCLLIYVLPLKIQLSREEGWYPINRFNSVIFLCLSQAKIYVVVFSVFSKHRWDAIVRLNDYWIANHHCLNLTHTRARERAWDHHKVQENKLNSYFTNIRNITHSKQYWHKLCRWHHRSIFLLCHLFFEEWKFTYFLRLGNTWLFH